LSKDDFALAYTHIEPRSQVGHGLDIKELEANSCQKQEIFLFPEASRPVTGHTHPFIQWVPRVSYCGGQKRPGHEAGQSVYCQG